MGELILNSVMECYGRQWGSNVSFWDPIQRKGNHLINENGHSLVRFQN